MFNTNEPFDRLHTAQSWNGTSNQETAFMNRMINMNKLSSTQPTKGLLIITFQECVAHIV